MIFNLLWMSWTSFKPIESRSSAQLSSNLSKWISNLLEGV